MIKKYKFIMALAFIVIVLLLLFTKDAKNTEVIHSKKIVSLSTFTLFDIAKRISNNTLELVKIIPSAVDIHAYEPTPSIMAKVERSDLLIYSGAGLEPWLDSFHFKNKKIAIANFIRLKHLSEDESQEHEHHGHGCTHSAFDPHFWLDIENMKSAANIITYELIGLEPRHKLLYLDNRDKYIKMLDSLDVKYKESLKSCKLESIVTNHDAFSYLSEKYNFKVTSLKGLSPDSEPSPKDMIRIIKEIKEHKTVIIFYEDFSSNKSMQILAKEANVAMGSLHTLGNITKDDVKNKRSYEDIMLQNLQKISQALICQ